VDRRPIIWDYWNRKHLGQEHSERSISLDEIDEVLNDAGRFETYLDRRDAHQVIGRTRAGRWLVVVWIDERLGRYPIHARQAGRREIREVENDG
jgi:uncharacterized DUF497 family protein